MTRLVSIVLAVLALAACDKPTPEDCRKALSNMQRLLGTEHLNTDANLEGEVRRCRGGSKRKAVECAIKATTLDELRACDFEKVPGKETLKGMGSDVPAGSAMAPAGSAATAPAGSAAMAPAGSAAMTPAGSAAPAATGSAAAAAGSAATTTGTKSGSAK